MTSLRPDADVDRVGQDSWPVSSGALAEHSVEDLPNSGLLLLVQIGVSLSGLAWSPDGRQLAYGSEGVGGSIDEGAQIWLLRLGDKSARQLTHGTGAENGDPIWSRDGKQIYYQSSDGFRSITRAGTNDRRILDEGRACLALSPDNTRIAFNRTESAGYFTVQYSLLMVMRADGSDKQPVTADASP